MAKRELTGPEKSFMRAIWVLPLFMVLGAAVAMAADNSVWISVGCAAGVVAWIAFGQMKQVVAGRRGGVASADRDGR